MREAEPAELALVHEPAYVEDLLRHAGQSGFFDADTYYSEGSISAALGAAGGAITLIEALWRRGGRALALPRPPGHHARPGAAMGFCLVNHVALAAARALALGAERVAIVDWDVHHGNGTEEIFYDDPRVLYVSLHERPLYPGTGALTDVGSGEGRGFTVNVPLSAGADNAVYAEAFRRIVEPVLAEFRPEVLLVSAGFDAHQRDPLAHMGLDHRAYADMTRRLLGVAPGVPFAVFLEGGYDLTGLETSLAATARVLLEGADVPAPDPLSQAAGALSARHEEELAAAHRHHGKIWRGL